MYCKNCGKEIDEGVAFCRYCGTPQADDSGSDDETVLLPGRRPGKASEGEKTPDEAKLAAASVSKKKNLLPLLIGGIAAVVVLAVLIFAVSAVAVYNSPTKKYDRQLSLAERYLDDLDYEKAIAAYKAAIEIDPINPEAYKALAELYLAMDDSFSAQNTVQAGINASGDASLTAMLTEMTAEQNASGTPEENVPEEPQVTTGNITVKVMAANETGAISGAEVKLSGASGEFSGETGSDGKVSFSEIEYGEYTVKCDAEGFHKQEMTVNVSGSDASSVVALVPHVTGDDAYVLLTWNGDRDLDLCAFNSDMKEYINIGHPADSEGNVFLYADHGADQPYEVIYIHNASAEIAKTIYVADAANARNGSSSQMEADGVTVRVYDSTGLIYESTADTSESAPLWCPCYYYAGTVYDQQDYIYDTTGEQYAWISFDEKDAYTVEADLPAEDEVWKQAYLDILCGYGKERDGMETTASIVYLDSDDVPELAVVSGGAGWSTGGGVYSYTDGKAVEVCSANCSVILGEGLILEEFGGDSFSRGLWIVKWDRGRYQELWRGWWETDEYSGEYKYGSNGENVTEEEYYRDQKQYFDSSKAVSVGYDMSYDEAIRFLSN